MRRISSRLITATLLVAAFGCEAGDQEQANCPQGMVRVPANQGSSPFCMDATEVTVAAYKQMRESGYLPLSVPGCYMPDPFEVSWFDRAGMERGSDYPAGGMTWCQAQAYCTWKGKRLCGAESGEGLDLQGQDVEPELLQRTEWVSACSRHGAQAYSYGDNFNPDACPLRLEGGGFVSTAPAGSTSSCEGGYPGLFDLSGSLWEWTNACSVTANARACLAMGGAATVLPDQIAQAEGAGRCSLDSTILLDTLTPSEVDWPEIGARCCADVP